MEGVSRSGRGGKIAYLDRVSIWWGVTGHSIHISFPGALEFITTVNDNPESKRGNPHLFRKLAACLDAAGVERPGTDKVVEAVRFSQGLPPSGEETSS